MDRSLSTFSVRYSRVLPNGKPPQNARSFGAMFVSPNIASEELKLMQDLNIAASALQQTRMLDAIAADLSGASPVSSARSENRILKHNTLASVSYRGVQTPAGVIDVSNSGMSLLTVEALGLSVGDVVKVDYSGESFTLEVAWTSETDLGHVIGGLRTSVREGLDAE